MSSGQTYARVLRLQLTGVMGLRFIQALTRGGPGGMPRPIEMHAHDPRRYLGDMLAWVHQVEGPHRPYAVQMRRLHAPKIPSSHWKMFPLATRCIALQAQDFAGAFQALASERELLVSLFGEDVTGDGSQASRRGNEQWPPRSSSGPLMSPRSNGMPHVAALLDRVFESICRPLKVRLHDGLLQPSSRPSRRFISEPSSCQHHAYNVSAPLNHTRWYPSQEKFFPMLLSPQEGCRSSGICDNVICQSPNASCCQPARWIGPVQCLPCLTASGT